MMVMATPQLMLPLYHPLCYFIVVMVSGLSNAKKNVQAIDIGSQIVAPSLVGGAHSNITVIPNICVDTKE